MYSRPTEDETKWKYLRRATVFADMNYRELEKVAKISNSDLSKFARGQKMPGLKAFIRLSRALDVPLHTLLYSNPLVMALLKEGDNGTAD